LLYTDDENELATKNELATSTFSGVCRQNFSDLFRQSVENKQNFLFPIPENKCQSTFIETDNTEGTTNGKVHSTAQEHGHRRHLQTGSDRENNPVL